MRNVPEGWVPFGTVTPPIKIKRKSSNYGGSQTPPRRKRRTIKHLKGKGYPGQWIKR